MCLQIKVMIVDARDTSIDHRPRGTVPLSIRELLVCRIEPSMMSFPANDNRDLGLIVRIFRGIETGFLDERKLVCIHVLELPFGNTVTEVENTLGEFFAGVVGAVVFEPLGDLFVEVLDHLGKRGLLVGRKGGGAGGWLTSCRLFWSLRLPGYNE